MAISYGILLFWSPRRKSVLSRAHSWCQYNSYWLRTDAFAHLLLATPKDRLCDSLACAEAWNYLRDVILLILSHHFLGDDEPLALMISPVICNTLLLLLQEGQAAGKLAFPDTCRALYRHSLVHFILSSPWTMNLCTALQDLFKGDSPSEYSSILAARLESVGTILLNEVSLFTTHWENFIHSLGFLDGPKNTTRRQQ